MSLIVGKRNQLRVVKDAPPGLYLDGGEDGEILLPGRYIPKGVQPGDILDVFIYLDSEDRLVATTETPLVMVEEVALLKVVGTNQRVGAFLNWGLAKDLLLPFREQIGSVRMGDTVAVYVYLDAVSKRIVATMRIDKHLTRKTPPYKRGQQVEVLVIAETPLGYNAVVDNAYLGLLYHSNLSGPLKIGQKTKAFVHTIREDRKIDLRLDASGYHEKVGSLKDQIFEALKKNKGRLFYTDKTDPQLIREAFGCSKNAFKLAVSALYKKRLIKFDQGAIVLIEEKQPNLR
jgi:predicted RNA-binding protein (virulence factor B family)